MPEWLQPVLIAAAILLVAYLIAVAVQVILALLLRRQARPMRTSIEQAQRDLDGLREQLNQLAPEINHGTREMPFGPLYDQARDLLRKGLASVNDLQTRITAIANQQIPEQPLASAFMLAPLSREARQRMGERSSVKTATVQLTEVSESLNRIHHIQADIAALPGREKAALADLRARAAQAKAAIDGETRPQQPLATERQGLHLAEAHIGDAAKLLGDARPPQSAVIVAYPMRVQAGEELARVEANIASLRARRSEVEDAAARATEQLAALEQSLAGDETSGLPRPNYTARAADLRARATAMSGLIVAGDYEGAASSAAELARDVDAQRAALAAVTQARVRITGLANVADGHAATVARWVEQAPAAVDLDVTRPGLQQLRDISDRLYSLSALEDLAAMEEATDMARQADEVFARISRVHEDFQGAAQRFSALTATLNDANVRVEVSKANQIAAELGRANRAYWGELTPEAIVDAAADLARRWQDVGGRLSGVRESELAEVVTMLEPAQSAFDRVGEMHALAVTSLTQLDGDRLQATTALNDDLLARLLDEVDVIGQHNPSMAEPPRLIHGRVEELRRELEQPAPDYRTINANAQRLRREGETFVAEYRQRLQRVLSHLGEISASIRASVAELNALAGDPRVDFTARVAPVVRNANDWLAEYDGVAIPLDAAQAALAQGEAIARAADEVVSEGEALRKDLDAGGADAREALAEASTTLSAAWTGLDALKDIGGERWGPPMLEGPERALNDAREQLARLEHPTHAQSPDAARAALDRTTSAATLAHERVTHAQADIAQRVSEVKQKRQQLSQAYELADTLAKEHPEFGPEWEALRARIAQLEARWTQAASYSEALDALTQAVLRTEAFTASARAQA